MGRNRNESEGSEREICEYVVQLYIKNEWVPIYKAAHFGYSFKNFSDKRARVINKTKGLTADLPIGMSFGDDLYWKKF